MGKIRFVDPLITLKEKNILEKLLIQDGFDGPYVENLRKIIEFNGAKFGVLLTMESAILLILMSLNLKKAMKLLNFILLYQSYSYDKTYGI